MRKKKIFIGLTDVAGFGVRFKVAFEKIGLKADFYSYAKHEFGFKSDKIIKYSNIRFIRKIQKVFLIFKILLSYDYVLYIAPFTLFPAYKDVKIFKFFGKKTMLLYTGCDVRIPESVEKFKWNPCKYCTQTYKDFVGCVIERKKRDIRIHEKLFDIIGAPFEAGGYLENFHDIFFPFDLDEFESIRLNNQPMNSRFRVFHAPSNEVYKGSKYIYEAIEKLRAKYDFDFIVTRNVSYAEYLEELSKADLVIDQMLLGSYGSVAIEAMILNKPVISYVRDDFWEKMKADCPIINANPDTLFYVLERIFSKPEVLRESASRGFDFVKKYHDDKAVASKFYKLFTDLK